ncbi:hypothetical protein KGY77_06925, partial [Candidatus Bipolaricaulota bacterium]|nr:hypothetical protein [Candidatus Bipolaricaulota bacterium]
MNKHGLGVSEQLYRPFYSFDIPPASFRRSGCVSIYLEEKMKEEIRYKPIGKLHSPHKSPKGTPIQPSSAEGVEGRVEIFPDYRAGLE